MKRIKLFEEFREWDRDEFLMDLFAMSSTEVWEVFIEEISNEAPNLEKIEVMLESGLVDVRAKNNWGWTPLHLASYWNHPEIAKLLIELGVDVNSENNDGRTPLHLAAGHNHPEIAKLLLDRGADLEAKDEVGWTPLHQASHWNSIETAKLLLERGADLEAKDKWGQTPLDRARFDKMQALLGGGL
jgi:ankyrin repeat protein